MFRIIIISLSLTCLAFADYSKFKVDNKSTHKKTKVKMISGKKNSNRFYQGNYTKIFNTSIDKVLPKIINFSEKCNNALKDRRKLTNKKTDCVYHNNNLVESKVFRVSKAYKKDANEIDRYLVARRIYNRQSFSHVDLVKIYEEKNSSGQKIVRVVQQMIGDKQAKKLFDSPVKKDSAFEKAVSTFVLTQIDANTTIVNYSYASETDHWLLNKSISVGQVFDSMGDAIGLLFDSIDKGVKSAKTTAL